MNELTIFNRNVKFIHPLQAKSLRNSYPQWHYAQGIFTFSANDKATLFLMCKIISKTKTIYEVKLIGIATGCGRSHDLSIAIRNCERHFKSNLTHAQKYLDSVRKAIS